MIINQVTGEEMRTIKSVSMIQLIANPEKYDNKLIRVKGFLLLEFERHVLYLSSLDYENAISENALQLRILDIKQYTKGNKGYVLIEGIFNMHTYGRRGLMYSGSIEKIERLEVWEKLK
jgi:hypothetical protein